MPVVNTAADDNTMPWKGIQGSIVTLPRAFPSDVPESVYCICCQFCPPVQTVFAGSDTHTRDKSSFLFYRLQDSDTVVMELWKNGVKIDDLDNNDNGTFYDFTSLGNRNVKGYLIDWKTVYDRVGYGAGCYQIKATSTLLSVEFEYESSQFNLMAWNERAASHTVKIETYQDGSIESSPIDYTGINWYSSYRLAGNFGNKQPVFTTDNYMDTQRIMRQIQDKVENTYTLELTNLSWQSKEEFIYNTLLANKIIITDYALTNEDKYRRVEVYPDSIEELSYKHNRPGSYATVKFKEKQNNILKRNG